VRRERFLADPAGQCRELLSLGFPMFTKPANAGSSVGVRKVKSAAELEDAVRFALQFDSKAIVEQGITGREIELAVLGGSPPSVSIAGEIVVEHADGFYSYDAKYLDEKGARLEMPAKMSAGDLAHAQALALDTFEVLECEGLARVDLFLTPGGTFYVNEINTLPGFTAISMYPKLWALSGVPQTELISRLLDLGLKRARERAQTRANYGA
jgi:D-alanine-D-alanine ligase